MASWYGERHTVNDLGHRPKAFVMIRIAAIAVLSFALAFTASALSVEIPVTPTGLDQGGYIFSVVTNSAPDGIAFHIVISAKAGEISPDSDVGVSVVHHWDGGCEIEPAKPHVNVALKRTPGIWTTDFIASRQLLQSPNTCFIFTAYSHAVIHGKLVGMPSAEFFEIRLADFAKP
jgi:hypothetical protein